MAEVDSLSIKITSSANAASKALDELIGKLQKLQGLSGGNSGINVAVTAMGNFTNATNSATSALKSFITQFASIAAVVKILKSAISESMNFTETFNYFNVAMKEFTQEAEDYAEKVNSVLGINVEQWENAQATFMSLGTTFGLTGQQANKMSKNLTQLVYDLSSLKNVDPTVALQKLRSAFAGEIEPLRAWGVDLSKANLQLAATELGITKTFNAMTQAEKAQLRYYVIMKQTTDAQGDMARTLSSPANQLRLLKQALTECARALGNVFIPMLRAVIPILTFFVKVITAVLEAIARLFGFSYPDVQWYGDYTSGVSGLGDAMDKTGRKAKKLKGQLAGFDEINNLTTNKGGGGGVGGLGGGWADFELPEYDFLGDLEEKANKVKKALEIIAPILLGIATAIGIILIYYNRAKIIAGLTTFITNVVNGFKYLWLVLTENPIVTIIAVIAGIIVALISLYQNCEGFRNWVNNAWAELKKIFIALQNIFNTLGSFIVALVMVIATTIWDIIKGAWETIKGVIIAAQEVFNTLGSFIVACFFALWDAGVAVWNWLVSTWGTVKTKAVDIWNGVKAVWQAAPQWFGNIWNTVKTKVAEKWAAMKQGAVNAWTGIKETFANIPNWFKEKFASAWQKVKDVFSTGGQIFTGIKEGIVDAFKKVVNAIITGINKVIATPFNKIKEILTKVKNVDIMGFKPFNFINVSWSVPQIPKLAQGGIITSPQLVMAGENGAEAIVPLENNTEWINKVAAQINATGNNDDVVKAIEVLIDVVNSKEIVIDGKSLARGISKEINRQTRILGEGLVY